MPIGPTCGVPSRALQPVYVGCTQLGAVVEREVDARDADAGRERARRLRPWRRPSCRKEQDRSRRSNLPRGRSDATHRSLPQARSACSAETASAGFRPSPATRSQPPPRPPKPRPTARQQQPPSTAAHTNARNSSSPRLDLHATAPSRTAATVRAADSAFAITDRTRNRLIDEGHTRARRRRRLPRSALKPHGAPAGRSRTAQGPRHPPQARRRSRAHHDGKWSRDACRIRVRVAVGGGNAKG